MTIGTMTVDGVDYHSRVMYNDDGSVIGEELIIDPDTDEPIPKTICLCHAYEPVECCCGAWDDVDLHSWYDDETY